MSLRATLWALDEAPVDDSVGALILLALADEANDDGTDACPYKDKLIKRARKSERTVQTYLRKLYQYRLIEFGDQTVALRRYGKQPGHAPRAWNLNLSATWENRPQPRTEDEMELYAKFMTRGRVSVDGSGGVQDLHPTADQAKLPQGGVQDLHPTEPAQGGVQDLHPTADQGECTYRSEGGVQPTAPFPLGSNQEGKPRGFGAADLTPKFGVLPGRASDTQEKIFFSVEDQEQALAISHSSDKDFFPQDLTALEQDLFSRCLFLAEDHGWTPRALRKVIGTPLIRKIAAQNPDLVREAFLAAADDQATTTPRRLLHMGKCPHWEYAAAKLKSGDQQQPRPESAAGPPPVRLPDAPAQPRSTRSTIDVEAFRRQNDEQNAARRAAEDARRRRLAGVGVGGGTPTGDEELPDGALRNSRGAA